MICGKLLTEFFIIPAAEAIQPACLPITSRIKTLVELFDIDFTSSEASYVDVAMYLATVPKPGQFSVIGKSLSIVFGKPIHFISKLFFLKNVESFRVVSCESPPPL